MNRLRRTIPLYFINLACIVVNILIILTATLYPFNFSIPDNFSLAEFFSSFNNASSFSDQVNNILLFMPFGYCCAHLLYKLKVKSWLQLGLIIFLSASLSLTVETLQIFLASRFPTPADIFNNTFGGCLGFICFYVWNYQSFYHTFLEPVEENNSRNSKKQITGFILTYLFLTLLISLIWQSTINLSNWDLNYPLIIGNERTGNKPWQGYISELYIADKAISNYQVSKGLNDSNYLKKLGDSLLTNYDFKGKCCYQEQTGNLPELLWKGTTKEVKDHKGVFLDSSQWLQTVGSAKNLSQRISETSEFTLSATIATDKLKQGGPARIISISADSLLRNLTLSQNGNSLDFRLRTPLTGQNGADLQLNIPNVFTDKEFHQIMITYSRGTIQVYVDEIKNSYSFKLLELIPKEHKIVYYTLTFIPLGVGLTILNLLTQNQLIFSRFITFVGILLPSLFLEIMLVVESEKSFSRKNLLLGILVTAGTILVLKIRASRVKAK
ncbi:VanZ family protein [Cronbergia sp. UHCC 0137]|uniref:VanZ family protein n=1 Tax=Cronbergia sp. UHCC 0137 TaxID=3110239 RepID=UPI002B1EC385|nr:VanZ family protein [Cronbergia sp. UHCC 0137]MEA5619210.1 VanZ family protein [Cronbergia sp. UHCC 0137]